MSLESEPLPKKQTAGIFSTDKKSLSPMGVGLPGWLYLPRSTEAWDAPAIVPSSLKRAHLVLVVPV